MNRKIGIATAIGLRSNDNTIKLNYEEFERTKSCSQNLDYAVIFSLLSWLLHFLFL